FAHGWFHTGDQGMLSDDGYLTLTGRLKELINRAGEKISPLEVDAVLIKHPAVSEAVCFAVPDEKYGEVVHAAVVLASETTAEEIQTFCREQLADFKVPERIFIADELPRTATGKIQRRHVATAFKE
ncbi:MAG: AMP-dependent synthetase, partial [Chloroflexi bacterium]|nr:AMP-dependent synthetase [Chloroflexota bacterium]